MQARNDVSISDEKKITNECKDVVSGFVKSSGSADHKELLGYMLNIVESYMSNDLV